MNYDYMFIQSVRDDINTDAIVQKFDNVASVLFDDGYPYISSKVELDAVQGENYAALKKSLVRALTRLESKLKTVQVIDDEFQLHRSFKDKTNNDIVYIPFTVELDDGQVLTGLGRHYGKDVGNKLNRNEFIKITRWYLNEQDITKQVYTSRADISDETKAISNIASIIEFNSKAFKKANKKAESKIAKLKEELLSLDNEERKLYLRLNKLSKIAGANKALGGDNGAGVSGDADIDNEVKEKNAPLLEPSEVAGDDDRGMEQDKDTPVDEEKDVVKDIKESDEKVVASDNEGTGDGDEGTESNFDSEIDGLFKLEDANELIKSLDDLEARIEAADRIDEYDSRLDELTDLVTKILEQNKGKGA